MKKTISKISAFAVAVVFSLTLAFLGNHDAKASSQGICCNALNSTCTHPELLVTFAGAKWVDGASNCNGHECPECDW